MTLIALALGRHQFLAAADILITDDSDAIGNRSILPLQSGLAVPFPQTFGRRIMSKAVILGNYLFLWAGHVRLVKLLLSEIASQRPASPVEFRELCESFGSRAKKTPELARMSFECILYSHDGEWLWGEGYPERVNARIGDVFVRAGGTGADEFLKNFGSQGPDTPVATRVAGAVSQSIVRELTERSHSYDIFGGGYEFFSLVQSGGFQRVPYSISEVSRFDHRRMRYMGWFQVARHIHCMPVAHGSLYFIAHISSVKSQDRPEFEVFLAEDLSANRPASGAVDLSSLEWDVKFSLDFMIGDWTLARVNPTPCAKMLYDDGGWIVEFDENAKSNLTKEYWRFGGVSHEPEGSETLLNCSQCGAASSEQH